MKTQQQVFAINCRESFECWYRNVTRTLRQYIEFSTLNSDDDNRLIGISANDDELSNCTANQTSEEVHIYPTFNSRALIVVIAYCCVFIVAVVGNVAVFVNLYRSRRRKSRISFLIIHLTIADLIVTFIMLPFEIAWRITVQWLGGNIACKILLFFRAFGLYLSSNVLICISLDRYFAVVHPLMMSNKRSRAKWMLYCAWVASTFYAFPQLLVFHVDTHPHFSNFTQCVSFDYFSTPQHEALYTIVCLTMMYFLPLMIIVLAYTSILWKMWRKARRSKADDVAASGGRLPVASSKCLADKDSEGKRSSNAKVSNINETTFSQEGINARKHRDHVVLRRSDMKCIERARIRTLKMTAVIVLVFLVCWTPYVVMAMWYMFDRESAEKVPSWLQDGLFMMAVSNSCMNPLVYGRYTVRTLVGGDGRRRAQSNWCIFGCFSYFYRDRGYNASIVEPRIMNKRRPYGVRLPQRMVDFTPDVDNKELICRMDNRIGIIDGRRGRDAEIGGGIVTGAGVSTCVVGARATLASAGAPPMEKDDDEDDRREHRVRRHFHSPASPHSDGDQARDHDRHELSSERSERSGRSIRSSKSAGSAGRQSYRSGNLKSILRN